MEFQEKYFLKNTEYWNKGYTAPNTESVMFRLCGRILKKEFNLPSNNERCLDFGCGQGANVEYLNKIGFDARGVDISSTDINVAKIRFPHISDKFSVCHPDPDRNEVYGWDRDISLVVGQQAFYYFAKPDFEILMEKIYGAMAPGAVIFASMMSTNHTYYKFSAPTDDEWLRVTKFEGRRITMNDYYNFYVEDEDDLKQRFHMFEPVHVGHYAMQLQEDETNNDHFTFIGRKPAAN